MASHASFIVADATPENLTFTRVDQNGTSVKYQVRDASKPAIEWPTVECVLRNPVPGSSNPTYKARVKVTMPIVVSETINGVSSPKKVRTYVSELSYMLPASGLNDERVNFDTIVRNVFASATLLDQNTLLLPLNGA